MILHAFSVTLDKLELSLLSWALYYLQLQDESLVLVCHHYLQSPWFLLEYKKHSIQFILAGSAHEKIDFNIVGIPQDNDQSSCKILQTIQSLEACRQMMNNEDDWNSSIYTRDVSNCLLFLSRKSLNKTNQEKPITIFKKGTWNTTRT